MEFGMVGQVLTCSIRWSYMIIRHGSDQIAGANAFCCFHLRPLVLVDHYVSKIEFKLTEQAGPPGEAGRRDR